MLSSSSIRCARVVGPLVAFSAATLALPSPQSLAPAPTLEAGDTVAGEKLPATQLGVGRIVNVRELERLEREHQSDVAEFVGGGRNGSQGVWRVPSPGSAERPTSGSRYIINTWGDTSMGIGFGGNVELEGVWVVGQASPAIWAQGLRAVGYRDGEQVSTSEWFREIGERPAWFPIGLTDIDRVVFEAEAPPRGSAWYGLDDLSFMSADEHVVLDFEDLGFKSVLTGSDYAGLDWEEGTGQVDAAATVIEQPLFPDGWLDDAGESELGGGIQGGSGTLPTLIQNFNGTRMFDTGANFLPPDTCGYVGLDHFVEVVNTNYSVYLKSNGNRVVNISIGSLLGVGGNPGDPRIVFDPDSQRWFVHATDFDDQIFLAVSLTDDPTGSFFTTNFFTNGGSDSGKWPDYPTFGVDEDGIYVGINQFPSGSGSVSGTIFALDKAPLIAASPSLGTVTAFRGLPFEGALQTCFTYGSAPGEYVISRNGSSSLRLRRVNPPLTAPTLTNLGTVSIPSHSSPPDAPALGSSTPLDSVDHRLMNSVYRNGSVWTVHGVSVGGRSAIRWYEINPLTTSTVQVGTIDDPSLSYIMGSIAVNANSDVVLGFSGSNSSQFAGCYYTGRLASDAPGQVAPPVQYKAGEAAYERLDSFGRNRWGDYSLCSPDPDNDLQLWTVQEFATTQNRWHTNIARLEFPGFVDCNNNGVDDSEDIANGTSEDCDGNGVPDECQPDCDGDTIPDACEVDCNANGTPDDCESFSDCNNNGIPDDCDPDCDNDGLPDDCETDCNNNGTPDDCEGLPDCDNDGIPDECEPDCDSDGLPDDCEADCNNNGTPDDCESFTDCNSNGVPDECEDDCDEDGIPDDCEDDCNQNGVPDECELIFPDCNNNGILDECEPDCDGDGIPDDCEDDCNTNGVPDDCDINNGTSQDVNGNGVPDECECFASNYCISASNSVGPGAIMAAMGSFSVSVNDTTLMASGLPNNQFGLFFYSSTQAQAPFGNGFRCVGPPIVRLPLTQSNGSGNASQFLDMNNLPSNGQINANEDWNFQFWYRDPMGGGAQFNTTDGLAVRFCE